MKALQLVMQGKFFDVRVHNLQMPDIGADEVLVKVMYAGVNPADYLTVTGFFNIAKKPILPYTLGYELCGKVVAKGQNVHHITVGDIVIGSGEGCFASYVALKENQIAKLPEFFTILEGAAIPIAALTAYQAFKALAVKGLERNTTIHEAVGSTILPAHELLQTRESLFIAGGTGAVGFMAIALAHKLGLITYVSGNGKKAEQAMALGAKQVFDYKSTSSIPLKDPVTYGLDMVGGTMTHKLQQLVKDYGSVVTIKGIPTGDFAKAEGLAFWQQQLLQWASMPYRYYAAWRHQAYEFISVKPGRQDLEYMLDIIQEIGYKPSIDSIYSLEEGEKALRYVNAGGLKGKVLLKIQ